jgi:hypothetical protein
MRKVIIDYKLIDIDEDIMERNSLVTNPAHQSNAYFFSTHEKMLFSDDTEQMILGVAIEADKEIFRSANEVINEDHTVLFTPETVVKIRNSWYKSGKDKLIRFEHEGEDVKNMILVQSYIVGGDKNPSLPKIFKQHVNKGSWILGYHVPKKEDYEAIKAQGFGGFSVEVSPYLNIQQFNSNTSKMKKKEAKKGFWENFFKTEKAPKKQRFSAVTVDGENVEYDGELAIDTVIEVVAGDGSMAPLVNANTVITVDGNDLAIETNADGAVVAVADIDEASDEVTEVILAEFAKEVRKQFSERDSSIKRMLESFEASDAQVKTLEDKIADLEARVSALESKGGEFSKQAPREKKASFNDLLK